jgi:hypothetical protein
MINPLALALAALVAPPPLPGGKVEGVVTLLRKMPPPHVFKLEPDMRAATGKETLIDPAYLVSKEGGLANCVVTLHPAGPAAKPVPEPLPDVTFDKVGPGYEPRVLVVPAGTTVTLRNRGSPCNGFVSGSRWPEHTFNFHVKPGTSRNMTLTRRDTIAVKCNRPYMLGWIVIVDTPWHARTDRNGAFSVANVPPGRYRVTVWHEGEGRLKKDAGPPELTVRSGKVEVARYQVK